MKSNTEYLVSDKRPFVSLASSRYPLPTVSAHPSRLPLGYSWATTVPYTQAEQKFLLEKNLQAVKEWSSSPISVAAVGIPRVNSRHAELNSASVPETVINWSTSRTLPGRTVASVNESRIDVASWKSQKCRQFTMCSLVESVDQLLHEFNSETVVTCSDLVNHPSPGEEGETNEENGLGNARHVKGNNDAYLNVTVKGQNLSALLDTGCELTLCPAALIDPTELCGSTQLMKAANGSAIQVLGETMLKLKIEGRAFEIPCLVTKQVSEIILGLSWMKRENVLWHIGRNWVIVRNHRFTVRCKSRPVRCNRVIIVSDNTRNAPLSSKAFSIARNSETESGVSEFPDETDDRSRSANLVMARSLETLPAFFASSVVAQDRRQPDVHSSAGSAVSSFAYVPPRASIASPAKDPENLASTSHFSSRGLCASEVSSSSDVHAVSCVDDFCVMNKAMHNSVIPSRICVAPRSH
jgi:hypothetical protein